MHHEAAGNVVVDQRDRVRAEEGLGDGDAAVGGVVERALEPLRGRGERGIERVDDDVARQRVDALGAHGVALVRHGGRSDLLFFQRLLDLAQVLQQAHVVRELRRRLGEARQRRGDLRVDLARVRLPAHRIRALDADLLRDELLEAVDFRFVAFEQTEERGLRPRGALDAEERELGYAELDLAKIEHQIMQP